MKREWDAEDIATIRQMLSEGARSIDIARHFNVSRSAMSGVMFRHINHVEGRPTRFRARKPNIKQTIYKDERTFIEPWAEYTARKKAERAAAKLALSECPNRLAGSAKSEGEGG